MASEVDICNLGLAHLGDAANLQSISPPDGSAQADHCARFYPIARDTLLEMHDWQFATKRATLAALTLTCSEWAYCYAAPADCLDIISILDPLATDDSSTGITTGYISTDFSLPAPLIERGAYTPQSYSFESAADGSSVIWTNLVNATLRYVARQTDTTKFSALFTETLSWLLASMLAGPVLKGDSGVKASESCFKVFLERLGRATTNDANQKKSATRDRQAVTWINGR